MKLKKLIKGLPLTYYRGNKEIDISGICSHSKRVAPGNLFISKKGFVEDGEKYIEEAVENGAAAVLASSGNPFLKNVVQLIHPDTASIEAKLAATFYDEPSKELFVVGITGTSGKTTVSYLVKHLFDALSTPMGLMGTIEHIIFDVKRKAETTTPDVITNHKILREMKNAGCKAAVMEVSSHGLHQGRVKEIDFDVAIFTNLSHEHLDYHLTMDDYAAAKASLFHMLDYNKTAVINSDSSFASVMTKNCKAPILTYGLTPSCDLYAHDMAFSMQGTHFNVTYKQKTAPFFTHLIGKHNVYNCLAALGACLAKEFDFQKLAKPLATFTAVRGRLEKVGSNVYVDYAHKPDALASVLKSLKELHGGNRLITVFGCGGERDQKKRPLMAEISETFSDLTIVTSDNPRSEKPEAIIQEILQGFKTKNYIVEVDRRIAIEKAISLAQKNDVVLIAGKGHETYPFDDCTVALEYLLKNKK